MSLFQNDQPNVIEVIRDNPGEYVIVMFIALCLAAYLAWRLK